jgi:hypothetical protein
LDAQIIPELSEGLVKLLGKDFAIAEIIGILD